MACFLPLAAGQLNLRACRLRGDRRLFLGLSEQSLGELSPLIAIPSAGVVAGLVALAVAVPVLRTRGIYLALATFALGQMVQRVSPQSGAPSAAPPAIRSRLSSGCRPSCWFAVMVMLLVWLLFATRFGIAVTAVHDDERVADLMGHRRAGIPGRGLRTGFGDRRHWRRDLCASFQLHRSAIFQRSRSRLRSCSTCCSAAPRRVLGPLLGAAVFTLAARGSARQRALALRRVCCRPDRA